MFVRCNGNLHSLKAMIQALLQAARRMGVQDVVRPSRSRIHPEA
jgi:hypothetical protein